MSDIKCTICGGSLDTAGNCVSGCGYNKYQPEVNTGSPKPIFPPLTFEPPGAPGTCGKCGAPWFYGEDNTPQPVCACWNLPQTVTSNKIVLDGKSGEYGACRFKVDPENWEDRTLAAEGKLEAIKQMRRHAIPPDGSKVMVKWEELKEILDGKEVK